MRHGLFSTSILLGLAQIAAAVAGTGVAAEPLLPGGELAMARAEEPDNAARSLDLRLDARQLRLEQDWLYGAPALASDWADRYTEQDAADRGLSFGLEIKPRSRIGALARQDETEDAGLGDQLQRLIEQPVLGVRGRYRF